MVGPPLNHTAVVVLGLVAAGDRNGWEITQTINRSTRFFWAASRGGIYPELKKLAAAGLLEAASDPRGEVTRHNYTITPAGGEALASWLTSDEPGLFDMRHEDLLRLFLSADLEPERQLQLLRRIRAAHERQVRDLEQLPRPADQDRRVPPRLLALDYGVALHRAAARWCLDAEKQLAAPPSSTRPGTGKPRSGGG